MVTYLEINAPDVEAASRPKEPAEGSLRPRVARVLGQLYPRLARSLCCCCKRRAAVAAAGLLQGTGAARSLSRAKSANEASPNPQGVPLATGDDEGYALLETPRRPVGKSSTAPQLPQPQQEAREEDFFDARSEMGSECNSPRQAGLVDVSLADPELGVGGGRAREVHERLSTLLAIEHRCRGVGGGGQEQTPVKDLTVEDILKEDVAQLWFCHSKSCPFVIGCLWCMVPDVSVEDAVQAIQDPAQRIGWDGDSFSTFKVLREHDPSDFTREDVVFTVIPVPRPVRDREILQKRWQVPLQDCTGGQALIMQSFDDSELKPVDPQRVRAFTHLSGYILRPLPAEKGGGPRGGVEIVVVSQCDLGGALPGWFQNLARRMAKRRCVAWGGKLGQHCKRLAQERCKGG